jgi:hypothetical protein
VSVPLSGFNGCVYGFFSTEDETDPDISAPIARGFCLYREMLDDEKPADSDYTISARPAIDALGEQRIVGTDGRSEVDHEARIAALTQALPANEAARKRNVAALAAELRRPVAPRFPHVGKDDREAQKLVDAYYEASERSQPTPTGEAKDSSPSGQKEEADERASSRGLRRLRGPHELEELRGQPNAEMGRVAGDDSGGVAGGDSRGDANGSHGQPGWPLTYDAFTVEAIDQAERDQERFGAGERAGYERGKRDGLALHDECGASPVATAAEGEHVHDDLGYRYGCMVCQAQAAEPPPASPPASDAAGLRVGDRVRCDDGRSGTVETTARDAVYWTDDEGFRRFSRERYLERISEHVVESPSPPPAALGPVEMVIAALRKVSTCKDAGYCDWPAGAALKELADELERK